MPPKEAHKALTAKQKETIRRWVAEGAKYEGHWAYQPVRRPGAPQLPRAAEDSPVRNPIDAFIQDRLAREGLKASPEADRRALIRRVSLDLTGIPPSQAEVATFLNDKSPQAYEKLVDRLLSSPRYAEKQAMHWLDAVRYADTSGFHGDNSWPAWPYRDYVLRAFRDNKPFDEFTREQIAGDLMPGATTEQRVASAYNRLNRVSAEGGLQPKEYLAKYAADRVRTTSSVWLGATMGCAECHDHKFDPIAAKDFYSMKAFFADIKETGLVPDRGRNSFGSKLTLPTGEQKRRFDDLSQQLKWTETELEEKALGLISRFAAWQKQMIDDYIAGKLEWKIQKPFEPEATNGATLKVYLDEPIVVTQYRRGTLVTEEITGDGLVVAGGVNPDNSTYTVRFKPGPGEWAALGIEVVQDESLPGDRFARGGDRFALTEVEAAHLLKSSRVSEGLKFALATTDKFGEQMENHAMNAIDGDPKTGWGVAFGDQRSAFIALRFAQKLRTQDDSVVTVRLRHDSDWRKATIGRFRLALAGAGYAWPDHQIKAGNPLRGVPADVLAALQTSEDRRSESQKKAIWNHFKWSSPEFQPLVARAARVEAERDLLESQIQRVIVTETVAPPETRVLPRGNWMDDSGEIVHPAIPAVFGRLNTGLRSSNRLDLANWIVSRDNPLTARVFVNRLWRQFFGTGLSKVLDDLGSQGEWPAHPDLLDWLAAEFMHPTWGDGVTEGQRDGGKGRLGDGARVVPLRDWDVKHIIRTIVLSHTYRQSSMSNSQLDERDPDNRLLARQSRYRVDAEAVRDIALSVSGLLVERFGGPSVRPYQPEGYLRALNFPQRDYTAGRGEDLYRRGLYTHWQRTFLHPSLMTFDAPSREECTVNRVNSNTPLQALVMLNDPIYVEAARAFAGNILSRGGPSLAAQLDWAFKQALSRNATAKERQMLADLHRKSLRRFQRDPASAAEFNRIGDAPVPKGMSEVRLAAMATVARAILNLHETITRN
jgi:hypothetical protein